MYLQNNGAEHFRSLYWKAERVLFGLKDWIQRSCFQSWRPKSTLSALKYWLLKNEAKYFANQYFFVKNTFSGMKRFELHPPVKKVGMKKIFLSHGTKRFFSYPLFVPRNKKILFTLKKVKFAAEMKETLTGNQKAVFNKKEVFLLLVHMSCLWAVSCFNVKTLISRVVYNFSWPSKSTISSCLCQFWQNVIDISCQNALVILNCRMLLRSRCTVEFACMQYFQISRGWKTRPAICQQPFFHPRQI